MKEFEIFKLEDRVLFEAAAVAEIIDAADAVRNDPNAGVSESDRQAQEERDALKNAPPENPADAAIIPVNASPDKIADVDAEIDALINGEIPSAMLDDLSVKELVVINGSVADKDAVIDHLQPNQEVLILKDGTGLTEVNEFLANSATEYSAIHFVTHGNEGYISLNGEVINAENFDAGAWQTLGEHLTADGDILLYSCNTAQSAAGQTLINMISDASGADVAASDDITGVSGNWELEYTAGSVEADAIRADGFSYNLTSYIVTDAGDSMVSNVSDVDLSDGMNLREAVVSAVAGDEIIFDSALDGQKITLSEGVLNVASDVSITGNGVNNTIIDGDGASGIFSSSNMLDDVTLTIKNLTLQNGYAGDGAAVYMLSVRGDVTLNLENVTISGCEADNDGGAIGLMGENVTLNLVNSTIADNVATYGHGGGVMIDAASFEVNVVNSTITGNSDFYNSGSGLYLSHETGSALHLVNSIVYGNGDGNDVYVENADPASANVTLSVVHSIYGTINDGGNGESFDPTFKVGSTELDYSDAKMTEVFGSTAPAVQNGVIQVNNQEIAGYSGTLVGTDAAGNYVYMDTQSGEWKDLSGNAAAAPAKIFSTDETGVSRTVAQDVLGVREFFVGAAAGQVYLKVAPVSATYKYDGSVKTAEVKYTTAKGTEVSVPSSTVISTSGITTSSANAGTYNFNAVGTEIFYNSTDVTGNFELDIDQTSSISITKRQLTLTSATDQKTYDGTALTNHTVTVSGDGFADGEGAAFDVSGSRTDAGKSANTFTYTLNAGTLAENYDITVIEGSLEVFKKTLVITVNVPTNKVYDGTVDVNSSITIEGVIQGDDLTVNAQWQYNDVNVANATTITNTQWSLSGADAMNYDLPTVPVAETAATISAKDVTVVYETSEPYYYDSTDQSGTVSAYYEDINGNRVEVPVNWNGKIFAAVGSYEITVTVSDTNYNPVNPSTTLVMNANNPAGGIYLTGIETAIPKIQASLLNGQMSAVYGDIYTMDYSELVYHSMLAYDQLQLAPVSGNVQVDLLEYKPMTLDALMQESTVVESSWVINPAGMISGQEIFSPGSQAVIQVRGDAPVESPEVLYIDSDAGADALPWNEAPGESVLTDLPLVALSDVPVKLDGFKSDFEKLLDDLVKA